MTCNRCLFFGCCISEKVIAIVHKDDEITVEVLIRVGRRKGEVKRIEEVFGVARVWEGSAVTVPKRPLAASQPVTSSSSS